MEKNQASEKGRREAAEYGDSSAMYWKLYDTEAEISDQKLVGTLTGDTNSMLILNGIFSAIIAGFIIVTYGALQPDNNQETVCLLSQLVSQGNPTQLPSPFCPGPYPGAPSGPAIRSNILLFISFFLAMTSVLACALIQQWCREFMKFAYPRAAPHKRGRVRTYLFRGLNRFYMIRFMYGVHVLLHISVFLFFCGFSDYLHYVYPTVGMISWCCVLTLTVAYAALSISPLIIGNCPYQTALTPPLRFGSTMLLFLIRVVGWLWHGQKGPFPQHGDLHFDKDHFLVEEANAEAARLDSYAMKWLFTDNDFVDTDMDRFLEGLPGYIHSHFTVAKDLPKVLTAPHILRRIREHLLTCATATELSEQARVKRASACVDSLRVILHYQTSAKRPKNPDEEESLRVYMQSIVDGLNTLCEESDGVVDLRAFCVRALAFQGFLNRCLEPATEASQNCNFPGHFSPLYTFFSSFGVSDEKVPPGPDEGNMWQALLYDGPLINLTLLSGAILSQDDVDSSTLSMCWKTLDILRSELRITRVDVSDPSLALFNEVHDETRRRVGDEEPGFSVIPLLKILDAVAGGRRLSMVFRDHPKYNSRADLVYGMDHLRNPDLFRAFANCLPDFVTKNPGKSMELLEDLVCYDYLWTSLQVNLCNSLRSNSFAPAKLRVFDTCCTVIDAAFAALENSQKVDWRAPDLGSLALAFELFVTDCFQGVFIERAIGFRIGLIKARFCKAVLAWFLDEFSREGTVVFRSQWDVASLARIFYSLGVGDDADVEFWKSFVDGGPIGAEFMDKAHKTLEKAARDGPLLNFCKLGYLGMMAVPAMGSGLDNTDFKKLLDLLQNMIEDSRRPLTLASTLVWEDLGRLRDEVIEIFSTSSDEDKANMWALLVKIDAVYDYRPSSTREYRSSDHVQAQAPVTAPVVQPNPPFMWLIPGNDGSNYAPTSTIAIEDRHDSSPGQGDDFRGITPPPFKNSHGRFANFYSTPYPLLPSQIGPGGVIAHPFPASFLPTLFPLFGSAEITSPGIPPTHPPLSYMGCNGQHSRAPVYFPPRQDTSASWASRSATLSSLMSPTKMHSTSSNTWFGSSSNGVFSSTPPSSPVHENKLTTHSRY